MLGALKTLCSRIASGIGGALLGSPCVAFLSFIYKKKQKGGLPYKEERERMNVCLKESNFQTTYSLPNGAYYYHVGNNISSTFTRH